MTHTIGLLTGAVLSAAAGFTIGALTIRPPLWTLGALAVLLGAVAAGLIPVQLRGSRWRVPRSWARFGHVGGAAAFGVMLGTGAATALASPALYLVGAWTLAAPNWSAVWPVGLSFGAGRALPFLSIAVIAYRRRSDAGVELDALAPRTARFRYAEAALLTGLAVVWIATPPL